MALTMVLTAARSRRCSGSNGDCGWSGSGSGVGAPTRNWRSRLAIEALLELPLLSMAESSTGQRFSSMVEVEVEAVDIVQAAWRQWKN